MAPEITVRKTIKCEYQVTDMHWQNISPQGVDLVQKLLEKDPQKRISLIEAMVHPWITDRKALKEFKNNNRKAPSEGSASNNNIL